MKRINSILTALALTLSAGSTLPSSAEETGTLTASIRATSCGPGELAAVTLQFDTEISFKKLAFRIAYPDVLTTETLVDTEFVYPNCEELGTYEVSGFTAQSCREEESGTYSQTGFSLIQDTSLTESCVWQGDAVVLLLTVPEDAQAGDTYDLILEYVSGDADEISCTSTTLTVCDPLTYSYDWVPDGAYVNGCSNPEALLLNIPAYVDEIPIIGISTGAFADCKNVLQLTIPDLVSDIGTDILPENYWITNLTLPASLESLNGRSFWGMRKLVNVTCPNSETFVNEGGVVYTADLTKIVLYPAGNTSFFLDLPDTVTVIGEGAFQQSVYIRNVMAPQSIYHVEDYAFYNCPNFEKIELTYYLESIGEHAFLECPSFIMRAFTNTCAVEYCEEHGIPFVAIGEKLVTDEPLRGDVSQNGTVDSDDAVLALKAYTAAMLQGEAVLTEDQTALADVNEDGTVDSDDAVSILKYYTASMLGEADWDAILSTE